MSRFNVPDDWDSYYSRCPKCGYNAHASEGYACPCDDEEDDEVEEEVDEEEVDEE